MKEQHSLVVTIEGEVLKVELHKNFESNEPFAVKRVSILTGVKFTSMQRPFPYQATAELPRGEFEEFIRRLNTQSQDSRVGVELELPNWHVVVPPELDGLYNLTVKAPRAKELVAA